MSHSRTVCEHGVTVSQCRCAALNKAVRVVRPCPFGAKHLDLAVVHPDPAAGMASEGAQLPPGAPGGACPVPVGGPGASGAAQGVAPAQSGDVLDDLWWTPPRAFKQCVFRSCGWTITEPDSLLAMAGMDEEIRVHLRTHQVEIELMAEAIER